MKLLSDRLMIREINENDLNFLITLEQSALVQEFRNFILSIDDIKEIYLKNIKLNNKIPREEYYLIVESLNDGILLGKVNLTLNSKDSDEWEIGFIFDPNCWGNGYATEAVKKVIDFAINDLCIHRVVAKCYAENTKSEKVMIRAGMKKEGCLRKVKFLKNKWHDEFIYSFLNEDFEVI